MFRNILSHSRLLYSATGLAVAGTAAHLADVGWASNAKAPEASPPAGLAAGEWKQFKLTEKEALTPNTSRFRFALDDASQVVGLPVASCLVTRAPIGSAKPDGSSAYVIRPYTPVSPPQTQGYFDLVVKVYPTGKMSKHIGDLKVGECLEVKGPIPKLAYMPNMKKSIGMVAGGTGITPMLQVVEEVLRNPDDKTQLSLIFANQTEQDIILRDRFDGLAKKHSNFKIHYMVDKAAQPQQWKGGVGYITGDVIRQHLPAPGDDVLILVCGPGPMMKVISGDKAEDKSQGELKGLLKDLGYTSEQVYKF